MLVLLASRSGSPGLSRIRSASPMDSHCCKPAVDPLFGSTSELPSAALTGSRRSPLLGLDEVGRVTPAASARRPSVDRPFGRLFRGHRARPLPDSDFRPPPSASGCHSRSLVPSSWFRTTSTAFSAHGSQACCILLPTLGFVSFPARPKPCIPRNATTPRRTIDRRGLPGHPVPWPP